MVRLNFSALSSLGYTRRQRIKTNHTMQPIDDLCQYPQKHNAMECNVKDSLYDPSLPSGRN